MRAEVIGVLVAVGQDGPVVLAPGEPPELPAGPLRNDQPSLQRGTRVWVEKHTGFRPGYLEQLYTFADSARPGDEHTISVSYLGLSGPPRDPVGWRGWYEFFPWEDQRGGNQQASELVIRLRAWAESGRNEAEQQERQARVTVTFGDGPMPWRPDLVLQRYELLYEAGLVPESPEQWRSTDLAPGLSMYRDHRRVLATGLARLRAKIEYRPVVFELLPEEFSLGELQRCVEAIAGQHVHTQNFRRFVETQELVEETGRRSTATGGRPAKLFRFRRAVLVEREVSGTKLPVVRQK